MTQQRNQPAWDRIVRLLLHFLCLFSAAAPLRAATSLHTTWLWHLHQPVYWPDRRVSGSDHYEAAWDTIQQQDGGRPHPSPEVLRNIFGVDDRKAAYQGRPRDALNSIGGYLNSGVQVSYSGALMENVQSLGGVNQLGYGPGWNQPNRQARGWSTTGGKPRMDLLNFTYHHALAPLLSDETLEMELRIHKRQMEIFWGTTPPTSRGYFPAETCFSTRLIPVLKRVGIEWSIVANSHLSRACADFPFLVGSGGENCDWPNRADQLNPAQGAANYKRLTIDRGISPAAAMPFAFQVHYVRHVDPETGVESKLIAVPSDQALGWKDSYSSWDLNLLNDLNARNDPAHPALALFAHDGDNAWSGGYSYYMEWIPNYASQAASRGYELTTVEQFLQEHPPAAADVVHIEDGGWVYADGDFGSPIFINWHWPPSRSVGGVNVVDPSLGASDKADNWRVILATENRVKTAQQVAGVTPRIDQVRDPGSFSTTPHAVELAWHYYLAGLDSGFVYYGCHDDECQRAAVAQSNAMRQVNGLLAANPALDTTPPTVFIPQRHPWNPGSTNFGVQYSYRVTAFTNSDFWVWTYAYDVSGITNVSLNYRANGANPPTQDQFQTYAGGPNTGPWITASMTRRIVAPALGVAPQYIADYYHARVSGISNSFVDYYVTATDGRGNAFKSPLQHVWVGQTAGTSTNPPAVPQNLAATSISSNRLNLSWSASSGALGYVIRRSGTNLSTTTGPSFSDTGLLPMTQYCYAILATNASGVSPSSTQACFTTLAATNPPSSPPFVLDGARDFTNYLWSAPGMTLYAALRGTVLYVATWSSGSSGGNDHFIFITDALLPAASVNAPWAKSGKISVAADKPFLAAESQNSFIGWFNAPAGSPAIKAPTNGGQMEGTIDLAAAFGAVPPVVYFASAAYATADGSGLLAQAPAGSGPDLDPNEFLAIPTVALLDNNGDGLYDRLDPALDFRLLKVWRPAFSLSFEWASMPGRSYQVVYSDVPGAPGGSWLDLAGAGRVAGPLQTSLSFTSAAPLIPAQRFYRVKLLSP